MLGDNGMKDKVLDKILEMLMGLKGSEDMEESTEGEMPAGEGDPAAGTLEIEIGADPLKAKN